MASFTKTYHRTSYAAISPTSPCNAQTGRTVLVIGASAGIGYSIARSFALASAAHVILTGRTSSTLSIAVETIKADLRPSSSTRISSRICDASSHSSIASLWESLAAEEIHVHVLVLSAAVNGTEGSDLALFFDTNVVGQMEQVELFLAQSADVGGGVRTEVDESDKVIVSITSGAAHMHPFPRSAPYAASKAAFASLLGHKADATDVKKCRMVSVHPGVVYTTAAEKAKYDRSAMPWDDVELPADFCVWLSTSQADFLHGRFVWAHWDIDELTAMKERILSDPGLLKIGLQGVDHVNPVQFVKDVVDKTGP